MYFITGLTGLDRFRFARCFGYYQDRDEALAAVEENRCSLNDGLNAGGSYKYIVIEKIAQGIHCIAEEEIWFQWFRDESDQSYWRQIPKALATDPDNNHAIG